MKKAFFYSIILVISFFPVPGIRAQENTGIMAGPMLGQVEYRDATIWLEAVPGTKPQVRFWKQGDKKNIRTALSRPSSDAELQGHNVIYYHLNDLEINTLYEYHVVNGTTVASSGSFITKDLWQWRKPVPDFSFLTGSCSYMNQPQYDRPGKPYGGDSSIFETMAKENSSFMLWLGDNWYTREVDYFSVAGLWYRARYDRSRPVLQAFLKKMPHYAIWDDHDFGPNDIGREFSLKEESRKLFASYWSNPSYGENGMGIYTKVSYGDLDIFMLDDRTWRSSDRLPDSIDGRPNTMKKMFGDQQMEWFKNALAGSSATFKIIATGSQVLNPKSPFDCFKNFPVEYHDMMQFIRSQKISGVLFLTGDRHHSEVIKMEGLTSYPLYDITVSPLTSGTHVFGREEKDNPYRVYGLDQKQNYARVSLSGNAKDRRLKVTFLGVKGENLGEWSVNEKELQATK
ncbi:MAG TPA: alkaline phosphatase D family protein [Chitinophagaceae bacterium]|nr:alkaline phosphatase D family protein [Chitinophagaceae bacterium]